MRVDFDSEILTATWHPTKPLIFFGTKSDQVFIYSLSDDLRTLSAQQTLQFKYEVNDLNCSPAGLLAVALGDGSVSLFAEGSDGKGFTKLESLSIHTADCYCVRFSPSGDSLCTGGADAQVTIWNATERPFVPLRCLNRMEWPIRSLAFNHDASFLAVGTEDTFVALEDVKSGQLVAKFATSRGNRGVPINCIAWHPTRNIFAFAGEDVDDRTGRFTGAIRLIGLC